jgi:hypothetical protein
VSVRRIGYWRNETTGDLPDPHDLVDEEWDKREREMAASYLEQGFIPWGAAGSSTCRICGKANGAAEFTDGVFLWPEGLAHYVREHSVRLPDEVLAHIARRFTELESLAIDSDWWPTVTGNAPSE